MIGPYILYYYILQGNVNFSWYNIKEFQDRLLAPNLKEINTKVEVMGERYWRLFHIRDYQVPLPIKHPLFLISPIIEDRADSDEVDIGILYQDHRLERFVELRFGKGQKFSRRINDQKLFTVPVVKGHLESFRKIEIWRDLFKKSLAIDSVWKIFNLNYLDMTYNLYILYLRHKFFTKQMSFFGQSKTGAFVVEIDEQLTRYKKEIIFKFVDGVIENYTLVTRRYDNDAENIRRRLLRDLSFSYSSKTMAKGLYNIFRDLSYQLKIQQEGMLYLFSAWSHDINNKEFLREIIKYLERGKDNLSQLGPLYYYIFKKYGRDFNSKERENYTFETKEQIEDKKDIANIKNAPDVETSPDITDDQRMENGLNKAIDNENNDTIMRKY